LRSRDLDYEIEGARAQRHETEALELRAMQTKRLISSHFAPGLMRSTSACNTWRNRSPLSWFSRQTFGPLDSAGMQNLFGAWLARGNPAGPGYNPNSFSFSAVISEMTLPPFCARNPSAEVRLRGQAGLVLQVSSQIIIPTEHETLPSAALAGTAAATSRSGQR